MSLVGAGIIINRYFISRKESSLFIEQYLVNIVKRVRMKMRDKKRTSFVGMSAIALMMVP